MAWNRKMENPIPYSNHRLLKGETHLASTGHEASLVTKHTAIFTARK
jgi:hypothetical protein